MIFNKEISAIDKVIDESGWDEPQKAYASSMAAALYFAAIIMIPVFLFLLGVSIIYYESIFTIQNLFRLVFVIILFDAIRNSGSNK